MANPNQITEAENAAHPSSVPLDPFAVDFFGGKNQHLDEAELFSEKETKNRKIAKAPRKSDWYKSLPRITNREAEFSNLLSALPENLTDTAVKFIARTIARYTFRQAENVGCSMISVREINLSQAIQKLNDSPKVFLTIGCHIENSMAVAALNFDFASSLIDSMLDGQGAEIGIRRGLSPVETTIVEFLAAKVLGELNNFLGEPMLFLQNVKNEPNIDFETFERGAEIVLSLNADDFNGVVRLFAPLRFLKALDKSQNALFTKKAVGKKLSDFEKIARKLDLRLQIGTTFLDAESLSYLETDDIVLIEQPQIILHYENFGGHIQVLVGRGKNFRLRGTAENKELNSGLNFKIEEILSEEARRKFTPAKFKMDEHESDSAAENTFENDSIAEKRSEEKLDEQISPSLQNVQVALRVEIAGGKISLRELQNLSAGQIITLGASPTDLVRLVTDNNEEPVAIGELVEIEGQLGVCLTKVFI